MTKFPSSGLAVVSIRTNRIPETVHFYKDVVGLSSVAHHGHQPAFELENGAFLVIVETKDEAPRPALNPRFPVLAFAVKDLGEAVARLKAHHIEMPWGIESNAQSRWVEFYDPGDNLIELVQPVL